MTGPSEGDPPPPPPTTAWTAAGETRSAREDDNSNRLSAKMASGETACVLPDSRDERAIRKPHESLPVHYLTEVKPRPISMEQRITRAPHDDSFARSVGGVLRAASYGRTALPTQYKASGKYQM